MKPTIGCTVHIKVGSRIVCGLIADVIDDNQVILRTFDPLSEIAEYYTAHFGTGNLQWNWPPIIQNPLPVNTAAPQVVAPKPVVPIAIVQKPVQPTPVIPTPVK